MAERPLSIGDTSLQTLLGVLRDYSLLLTTDGVLRYGARDSSLAEWRNCAPPWNFTAVCGTSACQHCLNVQIVFPGMMDWSHSWLQLQWAEFSVFGGESATNLWMWCFCYASLLCYNSSLQAHVLPYSICLINIPVKMPIVWVPGS